MHFSNKLCKLALTITIDHSCQLESAPIDQTYLMIAPGISLARASAVVDELASWTFQHFAPETQRDTVIGWHNTSVWCMFKNTGITPVCDLQFSLREKLSLTWL